MDRGDAIGLLMQGAVQAGQVPGVVVAAGGREEAGFAAGYGVRRLGAPETMGPDTVVWIASMTKAIVATAAMRLVEAGRLRLDAPAGDVVPPLAGVQVLTGFDAAGQPLLRAPKRAVTLRHLLTHTSGFAYDMWSPEIVRFRKATGTPGITTCRNAALNLPLLFDPGEGWTYGIGIDWVGKMVEAATGQRLGAHLEQSLFGPLGMADTAFRLRDDMRARLASVHARAADGSLAPIEFEVPQDPEFEMGGGGLYSTARDYLAFARMILNGGRHGKERFLKPETVAEMARDQIGPLSVTPLASAVPAATNDVDFFPGLPCGWGLSFLVNRKPTPQGRSAGGLAWAGLANTYYWIDHGRGTAGVFLTQIMPFFDAKAVDLFRGFEARVNGVA
ncbi:serine hydrolase domain-containing protein [Neoroseomonas soli]|uniref:Beta-lactamase family protein n=1 Tax=Neoroseomonas soli TaxID=1081025 RepID=A0A9X9WXL8_9PROT|nr:serine hydrolase domain-containing protein [Neoroseomonas soli]MBR0671897.1 beta-lactamase family protein [Neoroseomonas soli]